jgi:hypothetical protein
MPDVSRYYDWQGQPISVEQWVRLFEDERHIGDDHIGDVHVSTVYLGLNHRWDDGPPHIFETMIFGGDHDEWCWRYSTEAQARKAHAAIVEAVRDGRDPERAFDEERERG